MYSKKFLKFIEIWQKNFAIEKTIDTQTAVSAENEPLPWYTYPAIEYLNQFDYSRKRIFEYGCANSSLFWANRAERVVSVEDNLAWFAKWQKDFSADNLEIRQRSGADYEQAVFEDSEKYDVIVIDGIRRAECAAAAVHALAGEGLIILDDSDRTVKSADYQQAVRTLKQAGLLQVDFYGFCPMNIYPKTTSVFLTRNFDFPLKGAIQPVCGIGSLWSLPRKKRKELYNLNIGQKKLPQPVRKSDKD